jgi:hypothetical protein
MGMMGAYCDEYYAVMATTGSSPVPRLTEADKAKIFAGNALRVYPRLDGRLKAAGLLA